jgi:uncharacterized membrane protein YozB (DUF420 family)
MAPILAQFNLIFQIIILAVLFVGFGLKQRGKFVAHGSTMLIAVVLNAVSFLLAMGPSFFSLSGFISEQPTHVLSVAVIIHGILGAIAEILGIYLVVSWGLRKSVQSCQRRKPIMRVTMVLWPIAVFLGILLYALLYGIIAI